MSQPNHSRVVTELVSERTMKACKLWLGHAPLIGIAPRIGRDCVRTTNWPQASQTASHILWLSRGRASLKETRSNWLLCSHCALYGPTCCFNTLRATSSKVSCERGYEIDSPRGPREQVTASLQEIWEWNEIQSIMVSSSSAFVFCSR